jgi:hypothetical protein
MQKDYLTIEILQDPGPYRHTWRSGIPGIEKSPPIDPASSTLDQRAYLAHAILGGTLVRPTALGCLLEHCCCCLCMLWCGERPQSLYQSLIDVLHSGEDVVVDLTGIRDAQGLRVWVQFVYIQHRSTTYNLKLKLRYSQLLVTGTENMKWSTFWSHLTPFLVIGASAKY